MAVRKPAAKAAPSKKAEGTGIMFSKDQLLEAERFRERRDLLDALLSPDGEYTVDTAEQMIEKFMKGKVN